MINYVKVNGLLKRAAIPTSESVNCRMVDKSIALSSIVTNGTMNMQ